MNQLLQKAIDAVAEVPGAEQESIASLILQELESERTWDERFAQSQSQLGELVRRAKAEVAEHGSFDFDPSDRSVG